MKPLRTSLTHLGFLALTVALLVPTLEAAAYAQSPSSADSATRGAARDLGTEGVQAYQSGDYATALSKLTDAYEVLKAPTLALWKARAQEKNGRLVEASETYLECIRADVSAGGDQTVQEKAQAEAQTERTALLPRIPKLTVQVKGADKNELSVTIDGAPMSSALVGHSFPTNPGRHVLLARRGQEESQQTVELKEGQKQDVVLKFQHPAAASTTAGDEAADGGARKGAWMPIVGWIGIGVGAALVGTGVGTGLAANGKYKNLNCDKDGNCDPATDQNDIDSVNTLRALSPTTLVVGGVLAAAGVTLLLTAPKKQSSAQLSLTVGATSLGLRGRF
jgi:hypothetical protein